MPTRTVTAARLSTVVATATVVTAGCWHAPTANTEPSGPPRLVAEAIVVESTWSPVTVQAFDTGKQNLELMAPGESQPIRSAGHLDASDLKRLQPGDTLQAILRRELTVFVSTGGQIVGAARVLEVDPSYRVLTLEFADGRREIFKIHRGIKLGLIEPGDDVAIRTVGVIRLRPGSR